MDVQITWLLPQLAKILETTQKLSIGHWVNSSVDIQQTTINRLLLPAHCVTAPHSNKHYSVHTAQQA